MDLVRLQDPHPMTATDRGTPRIHSIRETLFTNGSRTGRRIIRDRMHYCSNGLHYIRFGELGNIRSRVYIGGMDLSGNLFDLRLGPAPRTGNSWDVGHQLSFSQMLPHRLQWRK